jgi:hypothetical protein
MVLSFLAGSKHAPVYASSEMYVVFLFVFRWQHMCASGVDMQ